MCWPFTPLKGGAKYICVDGYLITPKHCVCVNSSKKKTTHKRVTDNSHWIATSTMNKLHRIEMAKNKPFYYIKYANVAVHNQLNSMNVIFIILISLLFCSRCCIWRHRSTPCYNHCEIEVQHKTFNILYYIQRSIICAENMQKKTSRKPNGMPFIALKLCTKLNGESMKN